ncbi:GNAT family N-acetyltransferase [Caproiciproducens sp. CPB-2]|uniref:GNAT family N-acetyltransferase n=1 Tax=unclassified Caproiciproducens TaxID=2643836 RepID=UPI0023DC28D3|nr:GNAT family N-acetyltransferase [Caproiciproducens sp. CPB-2]MDF1493844.1 GNAT family N-acetyltransferase [Caproiciproducens sp. CPB-2]
MGITVREFTREDIPAMIIIWNEIVEDGIAFPQTELLEEKNGMEFFESQSFTGVAIEQETGNLVGLYILHPNNVGRCGHICNASYAVKGDERGKRIGEILVLHCITKAKETGFKILQFNAVVSTNTAALHLYKKLGFVQLGVIPGGFLMKDGSYQDIIPHYYVLQ